MKQKAITATAGLIVMGLLAGWTEEGLENSKHDFSKKEWSGGNACAVCHTSESEPPTAAPLWDASADLNRTFGLSLDRANKASMGTTLCLRCHDGTIARDTIAPDQPKRDRFANLEHPGLMQAGHNRSDHPVGIRYPAVEKDYRPMNAVIASGSVALPDGRVECISCHDPHGMSGEKHMLVRSNARSALCLTCHRK